MKKYVLVEYAKDYFYESAKNENGHLLGNWRLIVLDIAHAVPLLMLVSEFCVNKIRIPWHHVMYTMLITFSYFAITFVGQISNNDLAPYITSLNWFCDKNKSFYVQFEQRIDGLHKVSKSETNGNCAPYY